MLGKTVIRKPFIAYVKKAKEEKKEEVNVTEYMGLKKYKKPYIANCEK